MSKVLLMILTVIFLCGGCIAKGHNQAEATQPPTALPQNQTKTAFSHDGKYRAEAYGTVTTITAAGLYPYEGIRVVDTSNDEVIWKMEPGYYVVDFVWSGDDRYVAIYYGARIYGESIVLDVQNKKNYFTSYPG
jgi:hypothetical protein